MRFSITIVSLLASISLVLATPPLLFGKYLVTDAQLTSDFLAHRGDTKTFNVTVKGIGGVALPIQCSLV